MSTTDSSLLKFLFALSGSWALAKCASRLIQNSSSLNDSEGVEGNTEQRFDDPLAQSPMPTELATIPFGSAARQLFQLDPSLLSLNHGSYGTVPRLIAHFHDQLLKRLEASPDRWFRFDSYDLERQALHRVATFLNLPPSDCVFVENATGGLNCVIQSLLAQPEFQSSSKPVFLAPNTTYNACKLTLQMAAQRSQGSYIEFPLTFPIHSTVSILMDFRRILMAQERVDFLLLDLITSPTAIVFPYRELCELARSIHPNCHIFLDGAHSPGQIPLDYVAACHADYFVGNLHKWCYAPKGCAILWSNPDRQSLLHPLIVSHNYNEMDWKKRFWQQATRENTRFLAAAQAVHMMETIGYQRIVQYNTELANQVAQYFSQEFQVPVSPFCAPEFESPYMRVLELPITIPSQYCTDEKTKFVYGFRIGEHWFHELGVVIPTFYAAGKCWFRFSCQIYNEFTQYQEAAKRIQQWIKVNGLDKK